MNKFFDAAVKPPRGGWHFVIAGQLVNRYSEGDILEELIKWNRNNQTGKTEAELHLELWNYYCSREPARCGRVAQPAIAETAPENLVPRERTPEVQGPPIWTFLNTVAAAWTPALHPFFLNVLDNISSILECPKCTLEWQIIMRDERATVDNLNSRLAVSQWVNRIHNLVNERAGHPQYPYSKMVSEYGAPLP